MECTVENLVKESEYNTNEVLTLLQNLTLGELFFKPDQQTWSLAENLSHIILINESYFPIIEKINKKKYEAPFHSKFSFITAFFEKMILNSVKPDRKKKMKTFPVWFPEKLNLEANYLKLYVEHKKQFSEILRNSEDLLRKNYVIHSPASKMIVYSLGKAFEIMITHEKRHINQIKEVLQKL